MQRKSPTPEAQQKINRVISQLNEKTQPTNRRSPIRSNNSSVLGKSKKPVVIK